VRPDFQEGEDWSCSPGRRVGGQSGVCPDREDTESEPNELQDAFGFGTAAFRHTSPGPSGKKKKHRAVISTPSEAVSPTCSFVPASSRGLTNVRLRE